MTGFIQTWAGECSAWECDDLGHLNMRHYMTKVRQARQMMVIRLGLDEAFKASPISSVRVKNFHIKYLGEARPGDPLRIETGILDISDHEMRLCHHMFHVGDRLAATVVETIEHIYLPTETAFAWPKRVHENSASFRLGTQPEASHPRGFTYEETWLSPTENQLSDWGVSAIGAGVFQPSEIGPTGRAGAQSLLGRSTETIGHFSQAWPEMHQAEYREAGGSAALLEAYTVMGAPARTGDAYRFYAGIHSANTHTRRLVYNMVNVVTGQNILSMTGVGCLFNLKSRRLVKTKPAEIAAMNTAAIKEFSA